jgi:hypothetical protein
MSDINVIVNDEIVNIDVIDEPVLVNVVNSPGVPGAPGAPGVGVPVGGTTGQVLAKNSATNYDTEWVDVSGGAWGTITGTLSNQTDLQSALDAKFDDPTGTTSQYLRGDGSLATFPSLTGFVPYTGATGDVDLGTHRILAQNATIASSGSGDTVTLNHSSGSGVGLNITKGGNGEGLYINKTGGSGNAATIIGTINATTLVKSGGTSTQYLMADGSVSTLTNPITGTGTSGQVSYWSGTSTQAGSNNLFWDAANGRLGIGTNSPSVGLDTRNGVNLFTSGATPNSHYLELISNSGTDGYVNFRRSAGANGPSAYYISGGLARFSYNASTGDTILGSYANSPLLFFTGSTERARIFGGGNFGIGTGSTDAGQRLQVQGTTLLNGNVTFSSATGMTWDATNSRLGIGTNTPAEELTVKGTIRSEAKTGADNIFLQGVNSVGNIVAQMQEASTFGSGGLLFTGERLQGSGGNGIFFNSFAGNTTNNAGLEFRANGGTIATPADLPTAIPIIMFSKRSGGAAVNQMALFQTGNLLIQNGGTFTDSGERLQVTGTMKVTGIGDSVVMDSGGVAARVTLKLNTTSASYTQIIGNGTEFNFITIGSTPMTFGTNSVERMRIKTTGQVRFVPLASAPSSPQAGDVYYDSTLNKLRVYTTAWETITSI